MYILAKLVYKLYVPKQLEKGMRFITKQKDIVYGKVYEYLQLHELIHVPHDKDSYININGFPVEPYIVPQAQNPDDKVKPLVQPEQIGWFVSDEGGHPIDIINSRWKPWSKKSQSINRKRIRFSFSKWRSSFLAMWKVIF